MVSALARLADSGLPPGVVGRIGDYMVKQAFCPGCETQRWVIVDTDWKWVGCRRFLMQAMSFAARKAVEPKPSDELIYYGYEGTTAWAFTTPEELGAWASEHPGGTFDVQVREP